MSICPNCLNPIDAETKFCLYCDSPVGATEPVSQAERNGPQQESMSFAAEARPPENIFITALIVLGWLDLGGGILLAIMAYSVSPSTAVVWIATGIIGFVWFNAVAVIAETLLSIRHKLSAIEAALFTHPGLGPHNK